MTTPTNNAQVAVTQADREAAADLFLEIFSGDKSARHAARLLREGKGDKGSGGVQAFARHRIAAQADAAREVEALRGQTKHGPWLEANWRKALQDAYREGYNDRGNVCHPNYHEDWRESKTSALTREPTDEQD